MFWCDLETSDLNPRSGHILECGVIATGNDLEIVAEDVWLITVPDMAKMLARMSDFVADMHTRNGLLEDLLSKSTISLLELPDRLLAFAEQHGQVGSPLCGSSVHFDRAWLSEHCPRFIKKMSYRNVDVSTVHELAKAWFTFSHEDPSEKPHRALADLRFSIERLRWYRRHIFNPHSRLREEATVNG